MTNYGRVTLKTKVFRISAFVTGMLVVMYPIVFYPMMYPEGFREAAAKNRKLAGIDQSEIQPGNMKVWTDPFDRPGKPGSK